MSPATAARRLVAGLVLFAALSAHADEAAAPRAAVGSQTSPAPVAAAFAPVFEEPAGSEAIAADEEWSVRRDGRSEAPSELRDVPRFESAAVARTAAAGLPERGRDSSARLSVRGRNAGLLVGVSLPF